jgi:hypothetical protein
MAGEPRELDMGSGERELQALQRDLNHTSAYMDVHQVTWFGWYSSDAVEQRLVAQGKVKGRTTDSKLWFADDCSITPEGDFLYPDRDGVRWWNGLGYMMSEVDTEGEGFVMKRPKWKPGKGVRCLTEEELKAKVKKGSEALYTLEDGVDGPLAIQNLFENYAYRVTETLGGRDGYLVLGSVLAFGAAPEFFEREKWFSGLWLHGQAGSGKSTLGGWLMSIWGFQLESGTKITESSRVGMQILAQQYCNLPIWLEEYQSTVESAKIEFVKSLYNRESAIKKEFVEQRRVIRTNAIVIGEMTSTNNATQQRFPHVQVSATRRRGNHKKWFQDNNQFFFSLGRYVLQNRTRYVEAFQRHWHKWREQPELRDADERSKDVHGVGYAGFMAMAELLDFESSVGAKELDEYRQELLRITHQAVRDVREEVNVNKFWQLLVQAWKLGVFGRGKQARQYFRGAREVTAGGYPPGKPEQRPADDWRRQLKPWDNWKLYFDPGSVLPALREHLVKQRETMALPPRDLREQMKRQPYWIQGKGDGIKMRMGDGMASTRVWCIDLDHHPMGLQDVSDEDLKASRDGKASMAWDDPRLGDLHGIVMEVESALEEETALGSGSMPGDR